MYMYVIDLNISNILFNICWVFMRDRMDKIVNNFIKISFLIDLFYLIIIYWFIDNRLIYIGVCVCLCKDLMKRIKWFFLN